MYLHRRPTRPERDQARRVTHYASMLSVELSSAKVSRNVRAASAPSCSASAEVAIRIRGRSNIIAKVLSPNLQEANDCMK